MLKLFRMRIWYRAVSSVWYNRVIVLSFFIYLVLYARSLHCLKLWIFDIIKNNLQGLLIHDKTQQIAKLALISYNKTHFHLWVSFQNLILIILLMSVFDILQFWFCLAILEIFKIKYKITLNILVKWLLYHIFWSVRPVCELIIIIFVFVTKNINEKLMRAFILYFMYIVYLCYNLWSAGNRRYILEKIIWKVFIFTLLLFIEISR